MDLVSTSTVSFAEHTGLDSLQVLPEQLNFGSLFPPSQDIAESLWSAWSGDILLLSRQNPLLFHSRNGKQRLDMLLSFGRIPPAETAFLTTTVGNCSTIAYVAVCGMLRLVCV